MPDKSVKTLLPAGLLLLLAAGYYMRDTFIPQETSDSLYLTESVSAVESLDICSFNIQFLGQFKKRNDAALTALVQPYDIVVIQELVAPPDDGVYPDGEAYTEDPEADRFFDLMTANGYSHLLSEEDTGTGDDIHKKSSATEWWVAFYRPEKVGPASDLPSGFLAEDRSNHEDYERVPYAFAFRTVDGHLDFVLISVHLQPGGSSTSKARRKQELDAIYAWIDANDDREKDFIILGDMNIEDAEELSQVTPAGFLSLNDECRQTNTNTRQGSAKPYDHVMYNVAATGLEIDTTFDMEVINLIEAMRTCWQGPAPYPGDGPYEHNTFRQYFSDHHPVVFRMRNPGADDDGVVL